MREEQRPRRKDYITEYADAAFRFYALAGGLEKWRVSKGDELLQQAAMRRSKEEIGYIQGGISDPTYAAVAWSEAEMAENTTLREWMDLRAVESARLSIRLLENGRHRIRALEETICLHPEAPMERGDMTARIEAVSLRIPAGTRTIWRWIWDARILFAHARGLRLEARHIDRLHRMRIELDRRNHEQGALYQ